MCLSAFESRRRILSLIHIYILDTVAYTRELKQLGVGVLFLSDGIDTRDADAELRLSIMGSIAQEESRRTSARVKWGQTRRMEQGVVFGRSLLGYTCLLYTSGQAGCVETGDRAYTAAAGLERLPVGGDPDADGRYRAHAGDYQCFFLFLIHI